MKSIGPKRLGKQCSLHAPTPHPATPLPGNLSITVLLSPLCSSVPKVRKAECLPTPLSLRNRWPATLGCSHAASSSQSRSPGAPGPAREAQGHSALGWLQRFLTPSPGRAAHRARSLRPQDKAPRRPASSRSWILPPLWRPESEIKVSAGLRCPQRL